MANGYIYILANVAMPNLYKIGCTTKDAVVRAAELYTTGVPSKFNVLFSYYVLDSVEHVETEIHKALASKRWSESREFFVYTNVAECIEDVVGTILYACHGLKLHPLSRVEQSECDRCDSLTSRSPRTLFRYFSDDEIIAAANRLSETQSLLFHHQWNQLPDIAGKNGVALWEELTEQRAMQSLEST